MWYNTPMTQRILTLIFVASLFGATGCATTNMRWRDVARGAVIGAVIGTVVGDTDDIIWYDDYSLYPYRQSYYRNRYVVPYPQCFRVRPTPVYTPHGVRWVNPPTDPRCRSNFIWYNQFRRQHTP